MKHLNIVHITDLHGNTSFAGSIAKEIESADLVVISGDITHFGGKRQAAGIIEAVLRLNRQVAAVPGNCDRDGVSDYLDEIDISVDGIVRKIDDYCIYGMGGSLPAPVKTAREFSEEQFSERLQKLTAGCNAPAIAVIHQPPINTKLDTVSTGAHVGSSAVREFIEQTQPVFCFTGHIHESSGIDTIGSTTVVNPGPAKQGRYAVIDFEDGAATAVLKSVDN